MSIKLRNYRLIIKKTKVTQWLTVQVDSLFVDCYNEMMILSSTVQANNA
jgi:hypothetical protein